MSLVICSSSQDKYEGTSEMNVSLVNENFIPTSSRGPGIQNPNQFTNNINPVLEIPANSEVALKDISFSKNSLFKVGQNVSFSMFIGEFITSPWTDNPRQSLYDITSMPYPVPLQPGTYNQRGFCNMVNGALDEYIGYPDCFKNVIIEPAATQADGVNTQGFIFNITKGTAVGRPANRSAEMLTCVRHYLGTDDFTYTAGTQTYTATDNGFDTNEGIITDMPLSLNDGRVVYDVSGCTGGFRVGLIRPVCEDGREEPANFDDSYGTTGLDIFADIVVEYALRTDAGYTDIAKTLRIYHAVVQDGIQSMREVEYYNNVAADFDPGLNTYLPAKGAMFLGTASTTTDIGGNPTHITITLNGEDTEVRYTLGGTDYILTDSRLCAARNVTAVPASVAGVPTRNRFIKPTGITTWAMYPLMSLLVDTEVVVLDEWSGITQDGYNYPRPAITPTGINVPSGAGVATAGSSVYGRGALSNNMNQARIVELADTAKPYDSSNAAAQKQYVGLAGVGATDGRATTFVRVGEGNPRIPDPAAGAAVVAYAVAMILMPPSENIGSWKINGVMACSTSDVSRLFGFPNRAMVAQTRLGLSYLVGDAIDWPTTIIPTETQGAFFGWYIGSEAEPAFSSGPIFVRCPTLTHQSQNFGKGIPSKIIASLPSDALNADSGSGYYAPSEMTYLSLHNPAPLHFNDITLEVVDKMEEVLEVLDKSTTITLHFRKEK